MVDSREGGRCDGQNHITATLRDFTAWNKEIDVSGSAIVAGTANLDVAASKLEILSKVQSLADAACTYIKSKCILGPSVIQ